MTSEREKVKQRVIKLLKMTEDNGASENEALQAAQKAADLMAHYEIEANELDFKSRSCIKKETAFRQYGRTVVGDSFAVALARLCDVKCWRSPSNGKQVFFGFETDAEIACFMYDMLCNTVILEINAFKKSPVFFSEKHKGAHGLTLVSSFVQGMTGRISGRLNKMAAEKRETVQAATGTDLVPFKEAQIAEEFKDLDMRLVTRYSYARSNNGRAHEAGRSAGDRANIAGGVSGTAARGVLA